MKRNEWIMAAMVLLAVAISVGVGIKVSDAVSGIDFVEGTKIPRAFNAPHYFVPTTKTAAFTVDTNTPAYHIDTTAGAFTVSLPSSATDTPADGQCWEFSLTVANGAATFSPTATGDLLNGSQAGYNGMDQLGDSATICYDADTTNYYFKSRFIN